jgi:very-short-patch-repair endonuclease
MPVLVAHGVHVTGPRSWGYAASQILGIHRRDLTDEEHDGTTTALLRTVLDCAREIDLREALVVADAALRAGLDHESLRTAAVQARGPGAGGVRAVALLADARAESPIESCLRLIALPLARVEVQAVVVGVGRVDLLLDGWLVVEGDGFEFHSTRAHYREDRRRGNALVALGYVVLRFSYEDVVHRPNDVAATIAAVLARRSTPAA